MNARRRDPEGTSGDTLRETGDRLRGALVRLIATATGGPPRPTELARSWGLDQTLCIRVCSALKAPDALSVLHQLPSSGSLRSLVSAAREREVSEDLLDEAEEQVGALEQLIRSLGGQKANLDTLIGGQLLDARAKTEHTSKQNIFRGMSNLLGLQAGVSMTSYFVYPSTHPSRCNELAIYGSLALRRLLPERPILVGGRVLARSPDAEVSLAETILHGGELDESGYSMAIKSFSSDPFPNVEVVRQENRLLYTLPGSANGDPQENTMLFASIERDASLRFQEGAATHAEFGFVPRNPARDSLLDIFVHREIWEGCEPRLEIRRNDRWLASARSEDSLDRLNLDERLQSLGFDPRVIPTRLIPRYPDLLNEVLGQVGLHQGDFRLYRVHVRYAVVGLTYLVYFRLPPRH